MRKITLGAALVASGLLMNLAPAAAGWNGVDYLNHIERLAKAQRERAQLQEFSTGSTARQSVPLPGRDAAQDRRNRR